MTSYNSMKISCKNILKNNERTYHTEMNHLIRIIILHIFSILHVMYTKMEIVEA